MRIFTLTLILTLYGATGYAQTTAKATVVADASYVASEPLKGSNTMIITLGDSGLTAWKNTANKLMGLGYVIKSAQPELMTITTEPKAGGKGGIQVSMFANVQGNQVTFTGKFFIPGVDSAESGSSLEYRGHKASAFMQAWGEFDKVAAALGGTVIYARR